MFKQNLNQGVSLQDWERTSRWEEQLQRPRVEESTRRLMRLGSPAEDGGGMMRLSTKLPIRAAVEMK